MNNTASLKYTKWGLLGDPIRGKRGDRFGSSVATSNDGSYFIAGGLGRDSDSTGRVRIYKLHDKKHKWVQLGNTITGKKLHEYGCGYSVDMNDDGNIIVVGTPWSYDGINTYIDGGNARVYQIIDGRWVQIGQDLNEGKEGEVFGRSVAISGDGKRIVVGDPGTERDEFSIIPQRVGHVHVFEYEKGHNDVQRWVQIGGTIKGIPRNHSNFGSAVDISGDGNVVAIGFSREERSNATALVYHNVNGEWFQLGQTLELEPGDHCNYGFYAPSIGMSHEGKRVIIGAYVGGDTGCVHVGDSRVYEYENYSNHWKQMKGDLDGDGSYASHTSNEHSVDMNNDGNIIIIGDTYSGEARIYQDINGQWIQKGYNLHGNGIESENFGQSVSISGDGRRAVIGAPNTNWDLKERGHVHAFEFGWDGQDASHQSTSVYYIILPPVILFILLASASAVRRYWYKKGLDNDVNQSNVLDPSIGRVQEDHIVTGGDVDVPVFPLPVAKPALEDHESDILVADVVQISLPTNDNPSPVVPSAPPLPMPP